jgi:hypothetical protein
MATGGGMAAAAMAGKYTPSLASSNLQTVDQVRAGLTVKAGTQREIDTLVRNGDINGARQYMEKHPESIDAVLQAFAAAKPGLIPQLIEVSGAVVTKHIEDQQSQPTFGNRIWGGVRAVGGGLEVIVGGALVLAPEPTTLTKIGGGVLAAHGADNFVAGFSQLWTGRPAESFTQQGAAAIAEQLGADPVTASRIGVGVDIGVGLAGSGLASLGRLASGSRLVWGSIKATQPVYQGTVIPRSFELSTGAGRFWVAGNATEHMAEMAKGMAGRMASPNLINLTSQVQLSSLQAAVTAASKQGIVYGQAVRIGGWELTFAAPRQAGQLPSLIHALPIK